MTFRSFETIEGLFFTSDSHFSHARILELGDGRPFQNISHHNEMLIHNWNTLVGPEDTVVHCGDVALGPWPEGLNCVARLNGYKILIPGNHDRIFSGEKPARQERFREDYERVFDEIWDEDNIIELGGQKFRISHFPAKEVSIGGRPDRYPDKRPVNDGTPIIHGHTHQPQQLTWAGVAENVSHRGSKSSEMTPQVSVGVDAWSWSPAAARDVLELFEKASTVREGLDELAEEIRDA